MMHDAAAASKRCGFFRSAGTANDNGGPCGHCGGNKARPVFVNARHGNKDIAGIDLTRIDAHFNTAASALFKKGCKFPFHINLTA